MGLGILRREKMRLLRVWRAGEPFWNLAQASQTQNYTMRRMQPLLL